MPRIAITAALRKKLDSFKGESESYNDAVKRIYDLAVRAQLREFYASSSKFIPIDKAIAEAKKRWPRDD